MIKNEYKVIGVMSGTSLDGIDFVYATFQFDETWQFKIVCSETIPYNPEWFEKLKGLVSCSFYELKEIDNDYTNFLSK